METPTLTTAAMTGRGKDPTEMTESSEIEHVARMLSMLCPDLKKELTKINETSENDHSDVKQDNETGDHPVTPEPPMSSVPEAVNIVIDKSHFDPEADFDYENTFIEGSSRKASKVDSEEDAEVKSIKESYKTMCRLMGVTPSTSILKQLGEPFINLKELISESKHLKAVVTTLMNHTRLKHVDFTGNPVTVKDAGYIGELIDANRITQMNLSEMNLTGELISILSRSIKSCVSLHRLDMSSNLLCDKDGDVISSIIEDTVTIHELILHNNRLEDCGVSIGRVLADNRTLTILDLSWNHLRGQGAIGIARGLTRNEHLLNLNIGWNGFGFDGCSAIAHCLMSNTTLQVLDMTSNRIHLPALKRLMDGVTHNKTLSVLMIGSNPIPAHGTAMILDKLQKWKHGNLMHLDLMGVVVDRSFEETLKEMQEERVLLVRYATALNINKKQVYEKEVKNIFNIDPIKILFFMKADFNRTIDLFLRIDRDASGSISRDELKICFEMEGYPISEKALDSVMNFLDTDGDGNIDLKEFYDGERKARRENINKTLAAQKEAAAAQQKNSDPTKMGTGPKAYSQAFVKPIAPGKTKTYKGH